MSKLSPVFVDREASKASSGLSYSPSLLTYVTQSIADSVSTPATQRLGQIVIAEAEPILRTYEDNGVGGKRILSVIMPSSLDENDEQMDIRAFDAFRKGRNIRSYKQFSSQVIRPMIRISPEGFFEDEKSDVINHHMNLDSYGFGLFYKTVDENYKLIPVKDFSQLIPKNYIESQNNTYAYPFVYNQVGNYEQFLDPSHPKNDGAIDVFEVRQSLASLSPNDIRLFGASGHMMGGGIEQNKKGTSIIQSKIEIRTTNKKEIYDDAQDVIFSKFRFKTRGDPDSLSTNLFPLPGYVDDNARYVLSPFSEVVNYITGSYVFAENNANMQNFLSGSRNKMSEIGSRFKSATCGLIFGESNSLGTDSIAFGGLKK